MGDFISGVLGTDSSYEATGYQAGNPYDQGHLNFLTNQSNEITDRQRSLADLLYGQAQGLGANPAQEQYLQNVERNIGNTQSLIASQKGLNPALATKIGVDQSAYERNQANRESAILQQQQQLGAMGALGGLYNSMAQKNLGEQSLTTGANTAAMNANVNVAGANQQAAGQGAKLALGALGGGAGAMLMSSKAHGGMIEEMPDPRSGLSFQSGSMPLGGVPDLSQNPFDDQGFKDASKQGMSLAKYLKGSGESSLVELPASGGAAEVLPSAAEGAAAGGASEIALAAPVAAGAGEAGVMASAMEAAPLLLMAAAKGGKVKGKSLVKGDNTVNDVVPTMLSPGEIVIPKSIVESKDAGNKAKAFIEAILSKEHLKRGAKK